MGVLNVSPESFSNDGNFDSLDSILERIDYMLAIGADIIDIGAQSSKPGAVTISTELELERIIPVITAIKKTFPNTLLSIDTYKPIVMAKALELGVWMINDIYALETIEKMQLIAKYDVNVCLMHMQNNPKTMQTNPSYTNILSTVSNFLSTRLKTCLAAGIDMNKIYIDPGFGFGKSTEHNKTMLANLTEFNKIGAKILVGISRKSMLGDILKKDVSQRIAGGLATTVLAYLQGANIIRTHDVAETKDALVLASAVMANLQEKK